MTPYIIGAIAGSLVTFVVFAAYMAPKHWEWYHDLKYTKEQLRIRTEERDHYKQLAAPSDWGTQPDYEPRIISPKRNAWDDVEVKPGPIEHRFDDILEGTE